MHCPHPIPHGSERVRVQVGETQASKPAGPRQESLWVEEDCVLEYQTQLCLTAPFPIPALQFERLQATGMSHNISDELPLGARKQQEGWYGVWPLPPHAHSKLTQDCGLINSNMPLPFPLVSHPYQLSSKLLEAFPVPGPLLMLSFLPRILSASPTSSIFLHGWLLLILQVS